MTTEWVILKWNSEEYHKEFIQNQNVNINFHVFFRLQSTVPHLYAFGRIRTEAISHIKAIAGDGKKNKKNLIPK